MSDQEEGISGLGSLPIAELDDHRHPSRSSQGAERPRRGTFDSLYGAHRHELEAAHGGQDGEANDIRVRDFEEAIIDGGPSFDMPHAGPSSRRPTFGTVRTASPPNSVKAFAEARRREHENLLSPESRGDWQLDDEALQRTASVASRRSLRSRPRTVDGDAVSFVSNQSAQEDVCFPAQEPGQKDQLDIDFEYLEDFIADQRLARIASHKEAEVKVFPDLRPHGPTGSVISIPGTAIPGEADGLHEGIAEDIVEGKEVESPCETPKAHMPHDPNRICFFSSAWESTIHAAELGDLVLPGEDLRNLFILPQQDEDGVWWLNVNNPSKEEVVAICKAFGVHPLTTEDIATQETREKIELFPSYYFACFRSFNTVTDEADGYEEYAPFNIYAIVFREGTLSFSFAPNSHASNVRKRIALLKDFVSLSSDWICYALMYVFLLLMDGGCDPAL